MQLTPPPPRARCLQIMQLIHEVRTNLEAAEAYTAGLQADQAQQRDQQQAAAAAAAAAQQQAAAGGEGLAAAGKQQDAAAAGAAQLGAAGGSPLLSLRVTPF